MNNAHVTLWSADRRVKAAVADGWGLNGSLSYLLAESWMPFLRAGYSDDGGALLDRSVSAGVGHYLPGTGDLVALGLNWGQPSHEFGISPDDQITSELFYRLQLSPHVAITPTIQFVNDPALNPGEGSTWYFGLRARLSL